MTGKPGHLEGQTSIPGLVKGEWDFADHASGHASGPQLTDMIKLIQPQKVIPVHTVDPEAFVEGLENSPVEVQVPILGEAIRL